ncbi:MAG TPA: hypothetical protein VF723_09615 [Pyrinomonadaceae bacterium]
MSRKLISKLEGRSPHGTHSGSGKAPALTANYGGALAFKHPNGGFLSEPGGLRACGLRRRSIRPAAHLLSGAGQSAERLGARAGQ